MTDYLGWIGTGLLIAGIWLLGYKQRSALLFTAAGEAVWVVTAICREPFQLDLLLLSALFMVLTMKNWLQWGDDE